MKRTLVALVVASALASTAYATSSVKIGGALCQGFAGRNGAVCEWPNKPWAVAISSSLVIVWRNDDKRFVRSNGGVGKVRVGTDLGGAICNPQPTTGVVCRWPGKAWAVTISKKLVTVRRSGVTEFKYANK